MKVAEYDLTEPSFLLVRPRGLQFLPAFGRAKADTGYCAVVDAEIVPVVGRQIVSVERLSLKDEAKIERKRSPLKPDNSLFTFIGKGSVLFKKRGFIYTGSQASIPNQLGFMPMTTSYTTTSGPGNRIYHDANGNAYTAYGVGHTTTHISTSFVPIFGYDPGETPVQPPGPAPDPQNPLDSPSGLKSKPNRHCGISVSFEPGQFKEGKPTGPGEYLDNAGIVQGLGFVVSASVNGGGIGHFGNTPNPSDPNGAWTINQVASVNAVFNGVARSDFNPNDVSTESSYEVVGGNVLRYYDHPGVTVAGITSYSGKFNFAVAATNGKTQCELKFRVQVSYGEHNPWSVKWGSGNF